MNVSPPTLLVTLSGIAVLANVAVAGQLLSGQHQDGWLLAVCVLASGCTAAVAGIVTRWPRRGSIASTSPAEPAVIESQADPELSQNVASLDQSLDNKPWINLVDEYVSLFDEIYRLTPDLDAPSQEFAGHVNCRIQEILERSGVQIITGETTFDRTRHQAEVPVNGAEATVTATISPGFAVGRRVLRRARVTLAAGTPSEKGQSS